MREPDSKPPAMFKVQGLGSKVVELNLFSCPRGDFRAKNQGQPGHWMVSTQILVHVKTSVNERETRSGKFVSVLVCLAAITKCNRVSGLNTEI